MTVSTTSTLSNSVRGRYINDYIKGATRRGVYDVYCYPISTDREILQKQSSITVPFLSKMTPGETAISQTVDVTPQTLRDTTASISSTSRGEAIQDSEQLLLNAYTDYVAKRYEVVGENMQESVEAYLLTVIMAGTNVQRTAARASLDAGEATHRLNYLQLQKMENRLMGLRTPMMIDEGGVNSWVATIPHDAYYDLRTATPILEVAEYQKANILLGDNELGMVGKFRLAVAPWAKVFGGAGIDNGSVAATTLAAAATKLATTFTVSAATNLSSGEWITIGTEETSTLTDAGTLYPGNERVKYSSEASTVITAIGGADNGGLAYDHANGVAVRNADSVYPVICGGPFSVAKAWASDMGNGEFGQIVGPLRQGILEQWVSLGWKWFGGAGIISENWLGRIEVSSSLDA